MEKGVKVGQRHPFLPWTLSAKFQQQPFTGPGGHPVHQGLERVLPIRPAHPGGHQPAPQYDPQAGKGLSKITDEGKGRQGLAEVVEADPHPRRPIFGHQGSDPRPEIGIEYAFFIIMGRCQQILAAHGGPGAVVIVGQPHPDTGRAPARSSSRLRSSTAPPVPVRMGVNRAIGPGPRGGLAVTKGPAGPGINGRIDPVDYKKKGLGAGIQHPDRRAARLEGAGQGGKPHRRLAGFGHRGVDQKHVDIFPHFLNSLPLFVP